MEALRHTEAVCLRTVRIAGPLAQGALALALHGLGGGPMVEIPSVVVMHVLVRRKHWTSHRRQMRRAPAFWPRRHQPRCCHACAASQQITPVVNGWPPMSREA
eukprot:1643337-Prymnesium_polylepis.1